MTGLSATHPPLRAGYILLISILIIGVIASAVVSSLLLLGLSSNRSSQSIMQSAQAFAIAQGCAELALLKLHDSLAYLGDQNNLPVGPGFCDILPIRGVGNTDRLVCVEARVGEVFRRIEIIVHKVLPSVTIRSWNEVSTFTNC